ncbi:MAG TPA: low affinity iron permease family protein [Ohtaekwangia sp.]
MQNKYSNKKKKGGPFDRFSSAITKGAGNPFTFYIAALAVLIWGLCGPLFDFSDTWQLVINTGTTIITFLMVFVIQQSQNKDTLAIQLKLNELIAATQGASNRLIDIEDLTEAELETLKKFYIKLSDLSEKEGDMFVTHSIDEASHKHDVKEKSKSPAKRDNKQKEKRSSQYSGK